MSAAHDARHTAPDAGRDALDAFLRQRMAQPFAWGVQDCCLFAADAVHAQTGVDPAQAERGSYHDAATAQRLLERSGGLSTLGARAGVEVLPGLAQPGDVGLVDFDGRQSLAVCTGAHWLAPAALGLAALPFNAARMAWRVRRG